MKKGIQAKIKEEQLPDEPQVNQLASKIIFYYLSGLGLGICKLFPPLFTQVLLCSCSQIYIMSSSKFHWSSGFKSCMYPNMM